jgi:predicted O-methyltransferase YrrM
MDQNSNQELWSAVDDYLAAALIAPDEALDAALAATGAAGLPAIQVSAAQGKLLELLARMAGASSILEIGTLAGYSTIWLARALPADGRLVTLEVDPRHAEVATANIERAGFGSRVQVVVGKALDTLPVVAGAGPFDLFFIDADKANIPEYVRWALRLSRPGSVIVVDNVIRGGAVIDAASADEAVQGVRRLNELLAAEPRLDATTIQTVGAKGYDGFTLALVTG